MPAWTSSRSPVATGPTSAISTVSRRSSLVAAERQAPFRVDQQDVELDGDVAAGDAARLR